MVFLNTIIFIILTSNSQDIIINPPEIYLGYFPHDEAMLKEFEIVNNTRHPLTIMKVMPFCSCLEIIHHDTIVLPFSKGRVRYVFNSEGMSGQFRKEILVKTDRFQYQFLKFAIGGIIVDPPSEPKIIEFKEGHAEVIVYTSFWGGDIKLVEKPPYCWVRIIKNRDAKVHLYSHRRNPSGAIKFSIGRKYITLPIKQITTEDLKSD